jgi:Kae1-associated kinase Bud32
MDGKLLAQGAEAKIYLSGDRIVKDRVKKGYRLPGIDLKLRKERTRKEASILRKLLRAGILVPEILKENDKQMKLEIGFIDGIKLRDYLDETVDCSVLEIVGLQTAKMHKESIVHGDLTTSNMIKKADKIYFIDFGLSDFSQRVEDKAVDLHLFKECLVSKHHSRCLACAPQPASCGQDSSTCDSASPDLQVGVPRHRDKHWERCWNIFLEGYKKFDAPQAKDVLKRLELVEKRGRYKQK